MTKPLAIALTCLLLAPLAVSAAPEDHYGAVIFKDGFVLRGYIWEKSEMIVDNYSKENYRVPQGIFIVDEGARRFFIGPSVVKGSEKRVLEPGLVFETRQSNTFSQSNQLPRMRYDIKAGDFDEWMRPFSFHSQPILPASPGGKDVIVSQHLSQLTTQWARMDAVANAKLNPENYNFRWWYRTRELPPEVLIRLLETHKDVKGIQDVKVTPGMSAAEIIERRLKIYRFLVEVGYLKAAEEILAKLMSDYPKENYPKENKRLDPIADQMKNLLAKERMEDIRQAVSAGRHEHVGDLLAAFPKAGVDPSLLGEVEALQDRYKLSRRDRDRASDALDKLKDQVKGKDASDLISEAGPAIKAELSIDEFLARVGTGDSVGRLAVFLRQFDQAADLAKAGKAHATPEELLSLAVTSWLLGSGSGEMKLDMATRAWKARKLVLECQRDPRLAGDRDTIAAMKKYVDAETLAQLISYLPPPMPDKTTSGSAEPNKPTGDRGRVKSYTLQLPPEYSPSRAYPVLIALHDGGETGEDMVKRWGEDARRNGYILAAPDWGGGAYGYSEEEHKVVLNVIRDLRRRFQIDSDRVFLTGYGEGGTMAYDVGLSHPDLFAGVIPVCGAPRFQARTYDGNAQHLPFYVVWGQFMGWPDSPNNDGNKLNQEMVEKWINAGSVTTDLDNPLAPATYPVLGVAYRGRGREWFATEMPDVFSWMSAKKRANPKSFGRGGPAGSTGTEFRTMREIDNRFYFLSAKTANLTRAANLFGEIGSNNEVNVTAKGVKDVTVWFGRTAVDFSQPVQVRVRTNNGMIEEKATIKPRVEVLLQDFAERGDRQRLYIAKWPK